MKVDFTLGRFPVNGELRDRTGPLPWSAIVQPCSGLDSHALPSFNPSPPQDEATIITSHEHVARCKHCFAYINHYCGFSPSYWLCSLCGQENAFNPFALQSRYTASNPAKMLMLPEVKGPCFEALVGQPQQVLITRDKDDGVGGFCGPAPIFIALVDVGCSPRVPGCSGHESDFIDLVKSSLEAALEALPPTSLFGLVTFSSKMTLYDFKSSTIGASRTLHLLQPPSTSSTTSSSPPLSQPLSDIMPLHEFLAPITYYKSAMASTIDQLCPDTPPSPSPSPSTDPNKAHGGLRALGPALLSLIDYLLQGTQRPPFTPTPPNPPHPTFSAHHEGPVGPSGLGPSIQIGLFLSGPPDEGPGRVVRVKRGGAGSNREGGVGPSFQDTSSEARRFYEEASIACASIGACVDVFSICPPSHPVGLIALEPLSQNTGGAICLYPSADESAMPQDVYRRLSSPRSSQCLLRVRTSTGFRLSKTSVAAGGVGGGGGGGGGATRAVIKGFGGGHGRMFKDPSIEDLFHVTSCDPSDAFAFDFEHSWPRLGFASQGTLIPTLQVAFQYTTTTTSSSSPSNSSSSNGGEGESMAEGARVGWVQRRLKVLTLRVMVTQDPLDLYKHSSMDAILSMLVHRANEVVRQAPFDIPSSSSSSSSSSSPQPSPSLNQGRLLLRDWLVMIAAGYHRSAASVPIQQVGTKELATLPIDLDFKQAPALTHLTRSVYALIRSPLLSSSSSSTTASRTAVQQHPDLTTFIRQLYTSLPPRDLRPAVYPLLSSWTDPDHKSASQLPLRLGSINPNTPSPSPSSSSSTPCIFLIDAYVAVFVLYKKKAMDLSLPFPPPQSSLIAKEVLSIRLERRVSPRVRYMREGGGEEGLFKSLLLDEPDHIEVVGQGLGKGKEAYGLDQFLLHIMGEAQQFVF